MSRLAGRRRPKHLATLNLLFLFFCFFFKFFFVVLAVPSGTERFNQGTPGRGSGTENGLQSIRFRAKSTKGTHPMLPIRP